jgi:hypothetical protein
MRRSNIMKSFASRMVLARLLAFTPTLAAFAQQTSKDVFQSRYEAQNALTNMSLGTRQAKEGRSETSDGRLRSGKLFSAATDLDIRQGHRDGVPAVGEEKLSAARHSKAR